MSGLEKFKFLFIFFAFLSCKKKVEKVDIKQGGLIKYAKGFDVIIDNGQKKLVIKSPYQNAKQAFEYIIQNKPSEGKKSNRHIYTPIDRIIITSTTHIPMVELLGKENTIIGFPFGNYVSSKKTRMRIDAGFVKEIGKENALNTEILIDLQPELVVGFGVSGANHSLNTVQKSGINVVYNGDWLEQTPLGRAEWIKFFGVLFDKEKQADSIFKKIEENYNAAKKLASTKKNKPKVLSGAIMNGATWNLPAGKSFIVQFFEDAHLDYCWKDTKGNGSLSLSIESVIDQGQHLDFWISPGYFTSKKQLLENNPLYKEFKAFSTDKIYTPSLKKGKTGGIIYYELAPTRPDLVLKDLIKITNPELLKNYIPTFFEKMN